jgi:hypothetical protein
MRRARLLPAVVCAVTAAAVTASCGGGSGSSSTASGGRLVSYHRSGGLAYSNITLALDSGGHGVATATGPTGTNRRQVTLSPSEVDRLGKVLDGAPLADLPKSPDLGCADCYRYVLAYGGDHYATDEASVPSGLKPVIAALDPIAARAIPASLAPNLSG